MNKKSISHHHYILGIMSILVVLVIALQNSDTVTVRFLFWGFEMSRFILILLVFAIGFLSGYIFRSARKI